jgi:hypothetical protein
MFLNFLSKEVYLDLVIWLVAKLQQHARRMLGFVFFAVWDGIDSLLSCLFEF